MFSFRNLLLLCLPILSALSVQAQAAASADVVARGEYLARAGDCIACHTVPAGKLFGGGRPMDTPFGTLFTPNISSDKETGIGKWSAAEFYTMMHSGKSRDGLLLYPAMPFASYTKVTRTDSDAIYAYLQSTPPIHQPNRAHELRFPFNQRSLLYGWRVLFLREGEYKPDPTQSVEWNRGAYLVEGLGHCTMCHTAINALGGNSPSKKFEGGLIPVQNWYAPSLTSNKEAGLGDWSIQDISDLLQTGVSNRGAVYGPMAEVVYDSFQYVSDDDIRAVAVYLKSLPARFWTRNAPDEIEYAGEVQPGRLTNLGTIRRGVKSFTVTANSVRRAADLEAVVLAAASAAGCPAEVTKRKALTADELTGTAPEADDGPASREAACRRLGIEGVPAPEPRRLIVEGFFLPVEHGLEEVAREINRELGYVSVLEARDAAGLTPAEAVAAGGAALDRVLAMIDDCEWRLRRTEGDGKDTSMLPDPSELRRRLGIPAGSRRA